jgi:hypothetical protein
MSDVTQILSQIEQGDPSAAEQLLPLVYNELRKLAAACNGPATFGGSAELGNTPNAGLPKVVETLHPH